MTLTEFLLARIAEDEVQGHAQWRPDDWWAKRILAECQVKRWIITNVTQNETDDGVLRLMSHVYAAHPDYTQEWAT